MQVAITGGRGFVGRALQRLLVEKGHKVVILSQSTGKSEPDQAVRMVDYHRVESLSEALSGCEVLIHLIGILHENRQQSFDWVHHRLVENVVSAARDTGISRYLHMSALGADPAGPSQYLKSKAAGEAAAFAFCQKHGITMTALRPSIIFGAEDNFFNQFARMLRWLPVMPIVCPQAQFQPVAVEDVAGAFLSQLQSASCEPILELGGPEVITMREAIERVCQHYRWKRLLVPLPDGLSALQGRVMGMMPKAPFTYDNYLSLQKPNVTDQWPWPALGITPQTIRIGA